MQANARIIEVKSEPNRTSHRIRVLRLLLLLVAGAVVALLVEHWRGHWALNGWKRDMAAKGEIFEASRLWPAASKSDAEFSNHFTQITAQLRAALGPYAGRLSAITPAAPGKYRRGSQESRLPFQDGRISTNTWQDLDASCQQCRPLFQALHELMQHPPSSIGYDVTKLVEDDSLPNYVPIRTGAQSLQAAVMDDLHNDDLSAALRDLGSLATFARLNEDDPTLVGFMIRIAILDLTVDACWDALQANGWTEPQLAALQQQCVDSRRLLSQMPRALEAIRAERIYLLHWFRSHAYRKWLARNEGIYASFGAKLPADAAAESVVFWRQWFFHPIWSFAWADQEELNYLQVQQLDLMAMREAAQHYSWLRLKGQMAANHQGYHAPAAAWRFYVKFPLVDNFIEVASAKKPPASTTTRASASAVEPSDQEYPYPELRAWSTAMSYLTRNEMMITAIALKRHALKHGKPPPDLAALVPEFLADMPCDFMDGQSLRYRLNPDDSFTLYSVGNDLRDNGGDFLLESQSDGRTDSPWFGRDWVWAKVATGTEGLPSLSIVR